MLPSLLIHVYAWIHCFVYMYVCTNTRNLYFIIIENHYIQFYFHSFSLKIISSCFVIQLEIIVIIIFNSCIIFLACLGYKKNSKHIKKLLFQRSSLWSKWCSSQSCRQVYSSWGANGDNSQSKAGCSVRFLLGVILVQSRNFELFQQLVGKLAQLTKLTEEPNNVPLCDTQRSNAFLSLKPLKNLSEHFKSTKILKGEFGCPWMLNDEIRIKRFCYYVLYSFINNETSPQWLSREHTTKKKTNQTPDSGVCEVVF